MRNEEAQVEVKRQRENASFPPFDQIPTHEPQQHLPYGGNQEQTVHQMSTLKL